MTMSAIKTAISVPKDVYEDMDRLSRRLRVPRSRLFARAAREFLDRHRAEELTEAYNRAYAKGPTVEEKRFLEAARGRFRKLLVGTW